jgi:hypothetical protein
MVLRRAVKVSLKWIGVRDRRRLAALLEAYRAAVNFFVRLLWREPLPFSTATSKRLERTRLSARYRDQALKQAVEIVSSTRKSARELGVAPSRPFFRGMAVLDGKFVRFEPGDREHDLVVSLACLNKGHPLRLRTKRTRVLKKWLARPGARLVAGCGLADGDLLTLWVEVPAPAKKSDGPVLGVDVGVAKLLATSEGEFLGTEFRSVRDKVRRRRPGSKGRRRARRERDDLICHATKRLPWDRVGAVAFEDLASIKRGKKPGRGRSFRRAIAAWRATLVERRIRCLADEHGVLAIPVPAWGNSTTCPRCRRRDKTNRAGDVFRCQTCSLVDDADHVGALAAQRHGERLLPDAVASFEQERYEAERKIEQRKAAAHRRGQATAEKWRKRRACETSSNATRNAAARGGGEPATSDSSDSSSRGSQSPAARTRRGSSPFRDQTRGGDPENARGRSRAEENPEGGSARGRCSGCKQRGEEPTDAGPSGPRGNCQVRTQ